MKLLVTGGLGFIGSNFILNILKNNEKITITNIDAELLGSDHNNLSELNVSNNMLRYSSYTTCSDILDDVL